MDTWFLAKKQKLYNGNQENIFNKLYLGQSMGRTVLMPTLRWDSESVVHQEPKDMWLPRGNHTVHQVSKAVTSRDDT